MFTDSRGGFLPEANILDYENQGSLVNGAISSMSGIMAPFMAAGGAEVHGRCCLPLKIGMILRAHQPEISGCLYIAGQELSYFKLVGTVHNFQYVDDGGTQKFRFLIHDGTGAMHVDYLTGVGVDSNSTWMQSQLDDLASACQSGGHPIYVSVVGQPNLRGVKQPIVKAESVTRVENASMIFLHDLDVMVVQASMDEQLLGRMDQLRKTVTFSGSAKPGGAGGGSTPPRTSIGGGGGMVSQPGSVQRGQFAQPPQPTSAQRRLSTGVPTPSKGIGTGGVAAPTHETAESGRQIFDFLVSMAQSHPQGVHIKQVARQTGISIDEVKAELHKLEDEGMACYGKSDQFWSALD